MSEQKELKKEDQGVTHKDHRNWCIDIGAPETKPRVEYSLPDIYRRETVVEPRSEDMTRRCTLWHTHQKTFCRLRTWHNSSPM